MSGETEVWEVLVGFESQSSAADGRPRHVSYHHSREGAVARAAAEREKQQKYHGPHAHLYKWFRIYSRNIDFEHGEGNEVWKVQPRYGFINLHAWGDVTIVRRTTMPEILP